jgi:hypothetical protein
MNPWRQFPRLAPTVLATCTMLLAGALSLQAQQGPPPGGESRGMRPGGGRPPMMDPVVVDGPPAPDSMAKLVGLSGPKLERYTTMYQNLMISTRAERDSAIAFREARRAAREGGSQDRPDRSAMEGMRTLHQNLAERQEQFDRALEADVLDKNQVKSYHDWRDERRHDAEGRMREMRRPDGDRPGNAPA